MHHAFCDGRGWPTPPLGRITAPSDPQGFEGSAHALEVLVTRDQGCLPGLGEGGGEAIRVGQVVLRLEAGGQLGQFDVNLDNLNGKLGDLLQHGRRRFFPAWTASRASAMISRMGTAPKFVVGTSGRREAVLLDMNQYRRMLRKLEDLEDALALDRAERTSKKLVPYEDVRRRLKRAGKL